MNENTEASASEKPSGISPSCSAPRTAEGRHRHTLRNTHASTHSYRHNPAPKWTVLLLITRALKCTHSHTHTHTPAMCTGRHAHTHIFVYTCAKRGTNTHISTEKHTNIHTGGVVDGSEECVFVRKGRSTIPVILFGTNTQEPLGQETRVAKEGNGLFCTRSLH